MCLTFVTRQLVMSGTQCTYGKHYGTDELTSHIPEENSLLACQKSAIH